MPYKSRIPVDSDYVSAVGTAFYNFTYLEWVVVSTIVTLSAAGIGCVPAGKPASYIAKALIKAIESAKPVLPNSLRTELIKFHQQYLAAIKSRNKLLHAHPYTAIDGSQRLSGGGVDWPIESVLEAAFLFESTAICGNEIFHGNLTSVRP